MASYPGALNALGIPNRGRRKTRVSAYACPRSHRSLGAFHSTPDERREPRESPQRNLVRINSPRPGGMRTRLDPVAAQILRTARAELEPDDVVTASAWCTSCGRQFPRSAGGPSRADRALVPDVPTPAPAPTAAPEVRGKRLRTLVRSYASQPPLSLERVPKSLPGAPSGRGDECLTTNSDDWTKCSGKYGSCRHRDPRPTAGMSGSRVPKTLMISARSIERGRCLRSWSKRSGSKDFETSSSSGG